MEEFLKKIVYYSSFSASVAVAFCVVSLTSSCGSGRQRSASFPLSCMVCIVFSINFSLLDFLSMLCTFLSLS